MDMLEDDFFVGYSDDIATVMVARDTEEAQRKINQVMRQVSTWMVGQPKRSLCNAGKRAGAWRPGEDGLQG